VGAVLAGLKEKLALGPKPDYISLAGSGEPTLHARIGDVITGIKLLTRVPVACSPTAPCCGCQTFRMR
jgi:wyosine [tRNA(Phe)-imidazoG37] synthetase (radical SAM superfamily)